MGRQVVAFAALGQALSNGYGLAFLGEAVDHGATREEILETLGMAIYMGAGPSAMVASHALGAYSDFAAAKANAA